MTSKFSSMHVSSAFGVLARPEEIARANCPDMPCKMHPLNSATATCQCQMVDKEPPLTFGGGCESRTCETANWSAAPTTYLGAQQFIASMKATSQTYVFPDVCPSNTTAVASLASAQVARPCEAGLPGPNLVNAEQPGSSCRASGLELAAK